MGGEGGSGVLGVGAGVVGGSCWQNLNIFIQVCKVFRSLLLRVAVVVAGAAECRHMTDRVSRHGAGPRQTKYYSIFYTQGNTNYFYSILLFINLL